MPEGKHNLHLRHADEFNTLVEDFLEEWNHGFIIRLWRKRVGVTLKIKCRMWIVMLFWLLFMMQSSFGMLDLIKKNIEICETAFYTN